MKPNIHPSQHEVLAQCVCSNEFYFYSSLEAKTMQVEVCNKCHPFYTGKQQVITTTGRVDSFNSKFSNFRDKQLKTSTAPVVARSATKSTVKSKPKKIVPKISGKEKDSNKDK